MISGEAKTYFDTFRELSTEAATMLVAPQDCHQKVDTLASSIKNVMTDRCATNASFVDELKTWRNEVLPLVIENYNDLPNSEKEKLTCVNHLFCSIHVIHNLGISAEGAVKDWEKIAAVLSQHGGFQTSNSRNFDILYEISKLC